VIAAAAILGLAAVWSSGARCDEPAASTDPPIAAPVAARVLHMANRPDHIADDTLVKFEDSVLDRKLATGRSGYDLVVISAMPSFARNLADKRFLPIDRAHLQNFSNLDPEMLALIGRIDPGNGFAVPYLWGMTGIGVNVPKIRETISEPPLDSLALIFDPALAAKLAGCGIAVPDTPQDLVPAALAWLGLSPVSRNEADLARAIDAIEKVRPYFKRQRVPQRIDPLSHGQVCVALLGIGDRELARSHAQETDPGLEIAYSVPREGGLLWIDVLAIPADAAEPDLALAFIDFVLRPEVIGDITNTVETPNPNMLSLDFVDEELKTDPSVFPTDAARAKLVLEAPMSTAYERARSKLWARFKAAK
jgi:putrescine transport system substrate-binding protein